MIEYPSSNFQGIPVMKAFQDLFCAAALFAAFFFLAACATVREQIKSLQSHRETKPFERSEALFAQGNFDAAFEENQKALSDGTGAPDVALFNMGLISAYSLNPKRDYQKALGFFRKVVDHPKSPLIEQAKVWIQVLEEHEKMTSDKQRLAEEKRALTREKELLSHEKAKLRNMVEKSRQVDIDIERRRRQAQTR
jgi:tetratricopeptide (TPR) repeat protein